MKDALGHGSDYRGGSIAHGYLKVIPRRPPSHQEKVVRATSNPFEFHMNRIAAQTARMPAAMRGVMGGRTFGRSRP